MKPSVNNEIFTKSTSFTLVILIVISHLLAPDLRRGSTFLSVHFKQTDSTFSLSCNSQINDYPHTSQKKNPTLFKPYIHSLFLLSLFIQRTHLSKFRGVGLNRVQHGCVSEKACPPARNRTSCEGKEPRLPPRFAQHLTLFLTALQKRVSFAQQRGTG